MGQFLYAGFNCFIAHRNNLNCMFLYSTDYVKNDAKRRPLGELKSLPAESPSVECTYDIWQRRVPENRSFRKAKRQAGDENRVVNYETTI